MGASNFSGQFNKSADYFDGDGKASRESGSNKQPDIYKLMRELATQSADMAKSAVDAAASTVTAETPFAYFDEYGKSVRKVVFVPAAALTADNANYATIIVRARTKLGALVSIVAQVTTQITGSGNWTARVPVTVPLHDGTLALTVDNAKLDIPANGFLTYEITKTGSGVAIPAGLLSVKVL